MLLSWTQTLKEYRILLLYKMLMNKTSWRSMIICLGLRKVFLVFKIRQRYKQRLVFVERFKNEANKTISTIRVRFQDKGRCYSKEGVLSYLWSIRGLVIDNASIIIFKLLTQMPRYEFKKKYSKITYIKRLKLIDLAIDQGLGVTKAARQLRIKVPTAKVILSNYRKKHIIYRKKSDNVVAKPKVEVQTPVVKVQHQEEEEPEQIPDNFISNTQPSIPNMIILPCYYLTPYAVWPGLPLF